MINVDSIKKEFPIFETFLTSGKPFHFLDNAATSHKPQSVINAIDQCYLSDYAPVSRGLYPMSANATEAYEDARRQVETFINAPKQSVIFTKSATESLNIIAESAIKPTLMAGDEVWISRAEHHANYLPWLRVCEEKRAHLRVLDIDENGKLVLPPLSELKKGNVKCIALSLVSNVLGYYADVPSIIEQAKQLGIATVVDAAQAVALHDIDVKALGCDYLAFSGHKMFGPTGIGVLYVAPDKLGKLTPWIVGGGMVEWVGEDFTTTEFSQGVARFEGGSPNLAGAIGLSAAADFINTLDREAIRAHLSDLAITCGNVIRVLPNFTTYGDESNWQAGIVTFSHTSVHPHDIAHICGEQGVAIRAGHHCAQPLMEKLGEPATARVSFSIYNDMKDIEALMMSLLKAEEMFA